MRIVKEKENKEIKLVVKKQEKTFFIRITTDNTVDVVGFDDNEKIFDELFVMDEAKRRLGHVEEKLMYGEITALANKMGYCFANNKYFADLYGVTTHTVSQWISHLEKQGYLYTEIIRDEKMEVKERKIYIRDVPYVQKNTYPYVSKSTYPMYKNVQYNNINIRIDRLFNYIINNKGETPKELYCANMDYVYEVLNKFEMLYTEEILANYTQANIEKIKVIIYVLVEIALSPRGEKLNKISRDKLIGIYNRCKQNEGEINNFYDYYLTSVTNELDKL